MKSHAGAELLKMLSIILSQCATCNPMLKLSHDELVRARERIYFNWLELGGRYLLEISPSEVLRTTIVDFIMFCFINMICKIYCIDNYFL